MDSITTRVPATTTNLGPGFDALGAALELYNDVTVSRSSSYPDDPFFMEAAARYFLKAGLSRQPFGVSIRGDVPRSRGLGSSVTVRLGILMGLNALFGEKLNGADLLDLTTGLEGHPDNAVPAFYGGFAACGAGSRHYCCDIREKLSFVAAIPSFEMNTEDARKVLPRDYSREDIIINIQNTSILSAAFATGNYQALRGAFEDRVHQPYRAEMIPGFEACLQAARDAGALGAYMSGAGSTVMALTLRNEEAIGNAMLEALRDGGDFTPAFKILKADNRGARILSGEKER